MIATRTDSSVDAWSSLKLSAAVRGASLVMRVGFLRNYFLDKLLKRLETGYHDCEDDPDTRMHVNWLGLQLRPFLDRLIRQRPAAARAILRFIATWTQDVYRRTGRQRKGTASPCTVVIEPTDRCNLKCPGCYARSTADGSDLSYDQMVQIIDQVIDLGVTLVTISGGEPFLREKKEHLIARLAQRFDERGFLVYTNGTMIDEEIARDLGRVGNVFPAISVEGFEHQTDQRRGKGIYEQNRRVRQALARHGVMTGFSATLTRENCESICTDDFIDLRIAEGDLFGWFFLLQPIGRSPRPDLMVTADQRALLRETITRWRPQQRPIFLGDFWNDGPYVNGCMAGGTLYFHIYANGDISPCVFSPAACGNIFDIINGKSPHASLYDFVQDSPVFQAFRREQKSVKDRSRPCLLIDHPDAFRRIAQCESFRPAKNMAEGYLDGAIAQHVEQVAKQWQKTATLGPLLLENERGAYKKNE